MNGKIAAKMSGINIDKLAVTFILSVFSVCLMPEFLLLPVRTAVQAVLLFSIVAFCLRRSKWNKTASVFTWSAIVAATLGYAHYQPLHLLELAERTADLPTKIKTEFSVEQIRHQRDYQSVILSARLHPDIAPQRVYADWRSSEQVKTGTRWHGELQLRPLSARFNRGGFDRRQWYFSNAISARAQVKSAVKSETVFSVRQQRLNDSLQYTEGLKQQGLLLALGFGERAWLPNDEWQIYRQTNTAHLIAISGLHIGLAMLFGVMMIRALQIVLPLRWVSPSLPICGGLLLATLYAGLAGFAIPTLRALIALYAVYVLRLLRLCCNPWRLFLRVVAVLLLCDPLMVLSAGFWLSAGAVSCLILWYRVFPAGLLQWREKPLPAKVRWIFALFHLQFGLLWLFTPLQLAMFGGFSLYGFWANLLAVPLFSFILVPLVLFAVLTGGAFSAWRIADWTADLITRVLGYFQGGWIDVSVQTTLILTALLSALFLFAMNRLYRTDNTMTAVPPVFYKVKKISLKNDRTLSPAERKNILIVGMSLILYCLGSVGAGYVKRPEWRLETLDVGQGLATLIVKNGRSLLYDSGAAWQGGSMAELEILPYLRRQGLTPEMLILSHDDNDHSGGAGAVLSAYPQVRLITPSHKNYVQNAAKTDRTFCRQGEKWQWQGLNFSVLWPTQIVQRAANADSCVILVDDGRHKVLLTGDADVASENRFLALLDKVNVLQVGHHGSKTSTGSRLVTKIRPDIALISSGRGNPWRFPHQDVLNRLQQVQSAVYNTAVSGQISVLFYTDGIHTRTARSAFSPWYR